MNADLCRVPVMTSRFLRLQDLRLPPVRITNAIKGQCGASKEVKKQNSATGTLRVKNRKAENEEILRVKTHN